MIGSNNAPTTPPSDSPLLPCHAVVDVAAMIGSNNAATGTNMWTTVRRGGALCKLIYDLFC